MLSPCCSLSPACILLKGIARCLRRVGLTSFPCKGFEGKVAICGDKAGNPFLRPAGFSWAVHRGGGRVTGARWPPTALRARCGGCHAVPRAKGCLRAAPAAKQS